MGLDLPLDPGIEASASMMRARQETTDLGDLGIEAGGIPFSGSPMTTAGDRSLLATEERRGTW